MKIRIMTIDDYDAAMALWLSIPGVGIRSLDDSREGIARYLRRNPDSCFVAESTDGQLIGTILCGHDGRRGYIYHAAVAESARRQGVGRLLVDSAIDVLKNEGICKVCLVAFRTNETGNRFWESLGFSGRSDIVYRDRTINELNI